MPQAALPVHNWQERLSEEEWNEGFNAASGTARAQFMEEITIRKRSASFNAASGTARAQSYYCAVCGERVQVSMPQAALPVHNLSHYFEKSTELGFNAASGTARAQSDKKRGRKFAVHSFNAASGTARAQFQI